MFRRYRCCSKNGFDVRHCECFRCDMRTFGGSAANSKAEECRKHEKRVRFRRSVELGREFPGQHARNRAKFTVSETQTGALTAISRLPEFSVTLDRQNVSCLPATSRTFLTSGTSFLQRVFHV
jgi:hypothetical protein